MTLNRRGALLGGAALLGVLAGCGSPSQNTAAASPPPSSPPPQAPPAAPNASGELFTVTHTDAEWRQLLTPEQYEVLRNAGTEKPFTSPLTDEHRAGTFACAGCALELFSSTAKYDSRTGWPSFWQAMDNAVLLHSDPSTGTIRTEVHCRQCGGHLGHVLNDGPPPTGLRYCIDGVATTFRPT
jgi:peptide-methionine (R)-S-oxide reductase